MLTLQQPLIKGGPMIQVKFKNLKKSEFIKDNIVQKIESVVNKFSIFKDKNTTVTVEMENSPFQAGPDLYNVKLQINRGKHRGINLKKSSSNLYLALATVSDHLFEILNRALDKERTVKIKKSRKAKGHFLLESAS